MIRTSNAPFRLLALLAASVGALSLGGCAKDYEARSEPGVCWRVVQKKDGSPDYIEVARNQQRIEDCVARLDEVRFRFLAMGATRHDILGAYQGQFLFIDQSGVSYAQTLNGGQYVAMGRLPDGRLAVPGLMPEPSPDEKKSVTITQNPADQPKPAAPR